MEVIIFCWNYSVRAVDSTFCAFYRLYRFYNRDVFYFFVHPLSHCLTPDGKDHMCINNEKMFRSLHKDETTTNIIIILTTITTTTIISDVIIVIFIVAVIIYPIIAIISFLSAPCCCTHHRSQVQAVCSCGVITFSECRVTHVTPVACFKSWVSYFFPRQVESIRSLR